jgi:ABC-type antimicrobial peptide transport system permease subunit
MVWRRATLLVTLGSVVGSAAAFGVGRLLTNLLNGAPAPLPAVVAGACIVIAIASSVAALLPAAQAASVDPIEALRSE